MEYYAQLREYHVRRSLSRQSDALDAFRGILSRYSFHSFWGIPVVSS